MRIFSIGCFLLLQTLTLFAQKACIEGNVVDTDGSPIPDVHVIGVRPHELVFDSFDVTSTEDGQFQIYGIPAGDYGLTTGDDYGADHSKINFRSGKKVNLVAATAKDDECTSVTLHKPVRARIRLTATNLLTAQPIPAATATFRYDEESSWDRSIDGEDHLLIPPLLPLQIQAGATGYESSEVINISALQPGEEREIKVSLRPLQTGCIRGQVVDESGTPLSDVEVQPSLMGDYLADAPEPKNTDKNGQFAFKNAHPGKYILFVHGYGAGYAITPPQDVDVEVQPTAECSNTTIRLGPKAAKLEVRAVDAFTHQTVKQFTGSAIGITERDNWSMKLLENPTLVPPFTTIQVSAGAEGYQPSGEVTVSPLQPEEIKQITIELYPLATPKKKN